MGCVFRTMKWVVKALQISFQKSIISSKRVLNKVIPDPVKISAKILYSSAHGRDNSLTGCSYAQRVHLDTQFHHILET